MVLYLSRKRFKLNPRYYDVKVYRINKVRSWPFYDQEHKWDELENINTDDIRLHLFKWKRNFFFLNNARIWTSICTVLVFSFGAQLPFFWMMSNRIFVRKKKKKHISQRCSLEINYSFSYSRQNVFIVAVDWNQLGVGASYPCLLHTKTNSCNEKKI